MPGRQNINSRRTRPAIHKEAGPPALGISEQSNGQPDSSGRWRARSATGTVLTVFALGLQQVFEPDREQATIIVQTSGEPPKDLPAHAQLRQLGPRQSTVAIRPWLFNENGHGAGITA
jgi:hypothetical protein